MPIFEYQCQACEHRFEQLVKGGTGSKAVTCPECGKKEAKKQLSSFAAHSKAACGEPSSACDISGGCCPGCAHDHGG